MNSDLKSRLRLAALITGPLILLALGGILGGIYASVDSSVFKKAREESAFHRLLRDYDFKYRRLFETDLTPPRYEIDNLDRDLGRLEKEAESVESRLSVLKRRRNLARLDPRFNQAYKQSVRRAASDFPHAEPVAAIAAAALIHDIAVTGETEEELRNALPLLASPLFAPMRLGLHVLLGDFRDPQRAAERLPPDLSLTAFTQIFPAAETEAITTDLAIMGILAGDTKEATALIQSGLSDSSSPEFIRFAAEYYYDFGDLLRSAQLFFRLPDEAALGRQADALWLAGRSDIAQNIWTILAATENLAAAGPATEAPTADGLATGDPAADSRATETAAFDDATGTTSGSATFSSATFNSLQSRSLYNLALTAQTREEAEAALQRFTVSDAAGDLSRQFGLIRYSRLLETGQALAILEEGKNTAKDWGSLTDTGLPTEALFDLEILKRRTGEPARMTAETWLLLDRYPGTEELYQWAARFFNLQRNYTESAILLKNADRHGFQGQWVALHRALQQIREGYGDDAGETLASIPEEGMDWPVAANLGRIYEARLAPTPALESYQKAAALAESKESFAEALDDAVLRQKRKTLSRLHVRIARCLKTLDRTDESRQALENAVELDPDNLSARLELERL